MKTFVNLFSFVKASEFKSKGIAANVAFRERVYKEDDEFFFERNGKEVAVPSKNGLVVHKHMQIPLDDEIIKNVG